MKIVEFLRIGKEMLKLMSKHDIKCNDYLYLDLFDEYTRMRNEGMKVDYILVILSDKYKLSESTVKRIVKRFSKEVNL